MKNAGPESLLQLKATVCCLVPWDRKEPVYNQHTAGKHLYCAAQSFSSVLDKWKKKKKNLRESSCLGRYSLMSPTLLCF